MGAIRVSSDAVRDILHPTQNLALLSGTLPQFQSLEYETTSLTRSIADISKEISTLIIDQGRKSAGLMLMVRTELLPYILYGLLMRS